MSEAKLLGDKYKAMYERYYEVKVADKRAIAADDFYARLRHVSGSSDFDSVIDVGAGEGSLLARMEAAKFGKRLYACEISESGLEVIRSRQLPRLVDAQLFDGYHIPYPDKHFDLATCSHVMEHVEHERLLLGEMRRVAEQVVLEVPLENRLGLHRDLERNADSIDPYGHINFYNQTTFLNLLRTSGLKPTKWKVATSSVRYEEHLDGRIKGPIKNMVRRKTLTMFPTLAQLLFVYVMTVFCDCDA